MDYESYAQSSQFKNKVKLEAFIDVTSGMYMIKMPGVV